MLLLGFVFPAGESEAEIQTDLHAGDQLATEVGEVDQFPPVELWGNL